MTNYRGWSEIEENDLIGQVCDGNPILRIRLTLPRPVGEPPRSELAIKARIGHLYELGMININVGGGWPRY